MEGWGGDLTLLKAVLRAGDRWRCDLWLEEHKTTRGHQVVYKTNTRGGFMPIKSGPWFFEMA